MEHDRGPRTPPAISIRECQQAIEITGGIKILLRGEEQINHGSQDRLGEGIPGGSAEIFASP